MRSVLVSALLISVIAGTSALQCYNCAGADCGDPFSSAGNDTCSDLAGVPATSCLKTVIGDSVTRSCNIVCVSGCSGETCVHCCKSELCNGGNTVTTRFIAMGMALVAGFIFSRQ